METDFDREFVLPPGSIVIAGPTAAGKSEIALCLAQELGGEILSVDSMQVYRGLNIGTAKPSEQERAHIPHHLIDVVDVNETFNVARFVRLARKAIAEIQTRGRLPILCGGSGLYFKALFEGLGQAPPSDPVLRQRLEETPLSQLLRELAERDQVVYEQIDQNNRRRVMRAVEVIRLTGQSYSAQRANWRKERVEPLVGTFLGLSRLSSDLRQRIDARVEAMFRNGLVEETEGLLQQGLAQNLTALQALGYKQVAEYLRGERSLTESIELVKIRTRQFAKRQMTWFRRQMQLHWIQLGPDTVKNIDSVRTCLVQRAHINECN
jgi:tRNA dimethylallyltransferase